MLKLRGIVPTVLAMTTLVAVCFSGGAPSSASTLGSASGSSIQVGSIGDVTGNPGDPDITDGLLAYAKWLDGHGGISGHKFVINSCDAQQVPSLYQSCARTIASDKSDVANFISGGADFNESFPILDAAGLGSIDADPVYAAEFSDPNTFAAVGGIPVALGIITKYFATKKHIKTIAFTGPESDQTPLVETLQPFAKPLGVTVDPIFFPDTTTDYAATVESLVASKAGLILLATGTTSVGPLLVALKAAGNTIPVASLGQTVTTAALKQAGAGGNGLYTDTPFVSGSAATGANKTALKNYTAGIKAAGYAPDLGNLEGWGAGSVMAAIIQKLGVKNATRVAILNVIQHGSVGNVPLFPAVMSRKTTAPPFAAYGSLVNPTAYIGQYQNGKFAVVPGVGRINPFAS